MKDPLPMKSSGGVVTDACLTLYIFIRRKMDISRRFSYLLS